MQNTDGRLILKVKVTKNKKVNRNIAQIRLNQDQSAIRISLPSVFCILDHLLIQVYKRSGTTHRFVAVVLQILIYLNHSRSEMA